jgi:hypothetical protein
MINAATVAPLADSAGDARRPNGFGSGDDDAVRAHVQGFYSRVVRRWPPSRQDAWLRHPSQIRYLGSAWVNDRLTALRRLRDRLLATVPSAAWYEAAWEGLAAFPPQDSYCPLASAAELYRLAAAGSIDQGELDNGLATLHAGADPVQILRRPAGRMRLTLSETSYSSSRYDSNGVPIPHTPARRFVPAIAADMEDRYDCMSVVEASACTDAPSPTAMQLRRIDQLRGRCQIHRLQATKEDTGTYAALVVCTSTHKRRRS